MKASEIFKQYIWLVDLIYRSNGISLEKMNKLWTQTSMSGGIPMSRATFNRHKDAIEDIFGIFIHCERKGGYYYYIRNDKLLKNNQVQNWMLDSLSISSLLMDSTSLNDRILLEEIPSGREYLQPIINAMKQNRKLRISYRKFSQQEGYTILIEPYALKVFKQRWYLLANDYKWERPSVYALDRFLALEETKESFEIPSDFDTETFFHDCYGVFCGTDQKAQRIVIRAYPPLTHYLKTLPLHHSQKVVKETDTCTDFEFFIRPTFDFRMELLSQGDELEVLEPATFRKEMKEVLEKTLDHYQK